MTNVTIDATAYAELLKSEADLRTKLRRATWFLQDIANMGSKRIEGAETAAHALAQLGVRRERDKVPESHVDVEPDPPRVHGCECRWPGGSPGCSCSKCGGLI